MKRHRDFDTIPWQMGLSVFCAMVLCAGMFIGAMFGSPGKGLGFTALALFVFYGSVFTYNRIRYGIWGLR